MSEKLETLETLALAMNERLTSLEEAIQPSLRDEIKLLRAEISQYKALLTDELSTRFEELESDIELIRRHQAGMGERLASLEAKE